MPFLFCAGSFVTLESINYTGYPVESRFIEQGEEGLILSVTETSGHFLVLLKFSGETEPRLVSFPKGVGNESEMKKAMEKQNAALKFGVKTAKNGESQGENSGGDPADFEIIGIDQSKEFGKP